ncbi:hypothetical protein [Streptomyces sp. NPDC060031]|uniref:hypothetical protein n=1 Tax=Streptomyces sp. NPDC060031 TaxID=3347043 RepID=UPI00367A0154
MTTSTHDLDRVERVWADCRAGRYEVAIQPGLGPAAVDTAAAPVRDVRAALDA